MTQEITNIMLERIKEVEQRDEEQIIADLAGETVQDYVYEFTRWDTRKKQEVRVVKLSWVGVREVARARGNIILEQPDITETNDHWRIVLRGTDLKRNFSVFGGCHQPKKQKVSIYEDHQKVGEELQDDPYAFTKCLSKAQRNALEPCIPGDFALKMIDRYLTASGKKPLHLLAPAGSAGSPTPGTPAPRRIPAPKPITDWDKVTAADIPNLVALERVFWSLTKKQPAAMYAELGVKSRAELIETPWDAFLRLKAVYGKP